MSNHAKGFNTQLARTTRLEEFHDITMRAAERKAAKCGNNFLKSFLRFHVVWEWQLYRGDAPFPRKRMMNQQAAWWENDRLRVSFTNKLKKDEGTRLWEWKQVDYNRQLVVDFFTDFRGLTSRRAEWESWWQAKGFAVLSDVGPVESRHD